MEFLAKIINKIIYPAIETSDRQKNAYNKKEKMSERSVSSDREKENYKETITNIN